MDTLVFDLWGDYAHFKKQYTTTSPLTFPIPPRITILGLIGAILGMKRGTYHDEFPPHETQIGVSLLSPIKKARMTINLIDTKHESMGKFKNYTQIRFEFIRNPCYRIYFTCSNIKLRAQLEQHLKDHTSVYTPVLGLSELIANFQYKGHIELRRQPSSAKKIPLITASPTSCVMVEPTPKTRYAIETLPLAMKADRTVTEYVEMILIENASSPSTPMYATPNTDYWEDTNGNAYLFYEDRVTSRDSS